MKKEFIDEIENLICLIVHNALGETDLDYGLEIAKSKEKLKKMCK